MGRGYIYKWTSQLEDQLGPELVKTYKGRMFVGKKPKMTDLDQMLKTCLFGTWILTTVKARVSQRCEYM